MRNCCLFGLSRIGELCELLFDDVTVEAESFTFLIRQSKTDQAKKGFYFIVIPPYSIHMLRTIIICFPQIKGWGDFSEKYPI
jgi:hypothetical protein